MAEENEELLGPIELDTSLSDVEKPPELPAGMYVGEVQDVQVLNSAKGNPYYAIKFVIPTDELPADVRDEYEDGATFFWNRQLVPKGKDRRVLFSLRKLIEAFGLDANTTTIDPNEWMGCRARLRVALGKPYNGERRAEVQAIEAAEAQGRGAARRGAAQSESEPAARKPARGAATAGRRAR